MAKKEKEVESLTDRLNKIKTLTFADDVDHLMNPERIPLDFPVVNVAMDGTVDGGLTNGITEVMGESRTFKTLLGWQAVLAYLKKYPNSLCFFYDIERGTSKDYFKQSGINLQRIVYENPRNIEELVFDVVEKMSIVTKDDKVIVFVDSLGLLASKKEAENAVKKNEAMDMSRAKAITSMFRVLLSYFIYHPCFIINHGYKEIGPKYPKTIVGGGNAATLVPNTILNITREQEKNSKDELLGYWFNLNVVKSRTIRDKTVFSFYVDRDEWIAKYSGMFELAVQAGVVAKIGKGQYSLISTDGEVGEDVFTEKDKFTDDAFWQPILKDARLTKFLEENVKLAIG